MADKNKGEVEIHGKVYLTVARRIDDFRRSENFKGWSIETSLVSAEESMVVMKALIRDANNRIVATGYAEENRSLGKINKTSALENAETSAVGRALAFLGLGGTEIASADEVATAIAHGSLKDSMEPILKHNDVVRENIDSIHFIKEYIKTGDVAGVAQIWLELSNDIKEALWVAPTKGGVFTTEERAFLKSDEFAQARKEAA
jgi:hypothetical protein